jgi:hypothetical protein
LEADNAQLRELNDEVTAQLRRLSGENEQVGAWFALGEEVVSMVLSGEVGTRGGPACGGARVGSGS